MRLKSKHGLMIAAMITGFAGVPSMAQDHNYVPGWADTHNHRYKGNSNAEWPAKTELFAKLRTRGPAAKCTLGNISEADGNVIVNRYRSISRKRSEPEALQWAHRQVEMHHGQLKARGKC